MLQEGLSRLGDVLSSEPILARQALAQILADKVRFTPVDVGGGTRFEANLSLGRIGAGVAENDGDVPDGISSLLCFDVPIVGTVKAVA